MKRGQIFWAYPPTAGAHQLTFFSLRGPAKALHQRAPKARVVRMGGLVGGDKKGFLILLIVKYVNKQDVLIPNMVSKVVYGFFIQICKLFKFQISEF